MCCVCVCVCVRATLGECCKRERWAARGERGEKERLCLDTHLSMYERERVGGTTAHFEKRRLRHKDLCIIEFLLVLTVARVPSHAARAAEDCYRSVGELLQYRRCHRVTGDAPVTVYEREIGRARTRVSTRVREYERKRQSVCACARGCVFAFVRPCAEASGRARPRRT